MEIEFTLNIKVKADVYKALGLSIEDTINDALLTAENDPVNFLSNKGNPKGCYVTDFKAETVEDCEEIPQEPDFPDYDYVGA